ncbi:MAG: S8 family serine peptidase, partial [Candidatus Latescibacterota bacterium]
MNRAIIIPFFLTLVFCLNRSSAESAPYWVFFRDRGAADLVRGVSAKAASPTEPKNTGRRARLLGKRIFDERDLPVNPEYIAAVARLTGEVRTATRYFNGVSVNADTAQIEEIRKLPFVKSVQPVNRYKKSEPPSPSGELLDVRGKRTELSYGASFFQLDTVGVVKLHNKGYFGDGIRVGVLDSGYDNLGHAAFDSIRISHRWDFVQKDGDVGGDDHGAKVLSVLAALDRGNMIGAAPHATYLLARTEIPNPPDSTEDYKAEEDYFVAGVEWADSLGADVIQSSLGYTDFSDGPDYTYSSLDGETAITTIVSDVAAEKGIVVVVAAGNEGNKPWYYVVTPADGKRVIGVGSVRLDSNLNPVVSSFSS